MDKIKKFLRKLTLEEQETVAEIIQKVILDDVSDLDVKRLQGYWDIFRVRKGSIRIIFKRIPGENRILEVTRRSDTTYRKY